MTSSIGTDLQQIWKLFEMIGVGAACVLAVVVVGVAFIRTRNEARALRGRQ